MKKEEDIKNMLNSIHVKCQIAQCNYKYKDLDNEDKKNKREKNQSIEIFSYQFLERKEK